MTLTEALHQFDSTETLPWSDADLPAIAICCGEPVILSVLCTGRKTLYCRQCHRTLEGLNGEWSVMFRGRKRAAATR